MALILQSGASYPVIDATSYVSIADATGWLNARKYTVDSAVLEFDLVKAYDLMQQQDFKTEYKRCLNHYILAKKHDGSGAEIPPDVFTIPDRIKQAQVALSHCMNEAPGGLDATQATDASQLTHKGLGRGAIVKKWEFDKELARTDAISLLKRCPIAFELMKDFINVPSLYQPNIRRL